MVATDNGKSWTGQQPTVPSGDNEYAVVRGVILNSFQHDGRLDEHSPRRCDTLGAESMCGSGR